MIVSSPCHLGQDDVQAVPDDHEVGVVGDEAGGGAQVDDGLGLKKEKRSVVEGGP